MKCAFHPSTPAAGSCPACDRPLCEACLQAIQRAGVCSACLAAPAPQRTRMGLLIGLGVGGGIAIILLVIGLLVGLRFYNKELAPHQRGQVPAEVVAIEEAGSSGEEVAAQPGEEAAIAFASSLREGWVAEVTSHVDDWRTVHAAIGPSDGDWTTWLEVEWDDAAGDYALMDEGPIAQEEEEEVPDIYQPGEEVAKEAALADTPDWVARVVKHSSDWKTATVWVGPPQSEFMWAIKLRWTDELDCYDIVGVEEIPYP